MNSLTIFLIVFSVLSPFTYAYKAWEDKTLETKECFASYLRNISLLEVSFPAYNYTEDGYKCENKIKEAHDQFVKDTVIYMSALLSLKGIDLKKNEEILDCVLEGFKKYNLMFLYLKGVTFYLFNLTDIAKFGTETKDDHTFLVQQALSFCKSKIEGEKFDKSLEKKENKKDQCKVFYLNEKGLLDAFGWSINVSFFHENDCKETAHELEVFVDMNGISKNSSFFGLGVPHAATCIYEKFKNIQLNMKRSTIQQLMATDLDETQLKILRQNHVDLESKASEIIIDCLSFAMTIASVSSNNKFLLRVYDD